MNFVLQEPPSVFDSFNARAVSAERLAKGFIPSANFGTVSRRAHTLVVGPRGSGKTCLLKMLQPAALNVWTSAEAEGFKKKIDFSGVYIPADISWNQQLKYLGADRLPDRLRLRIEAATVTAHVLHAFISTALDRMNITDRSLRRLHLKLSDRVEMQICETLAKRWKIALSAPTLLSLKHSLRGRGMDIWHQAITCASQGNSDNFSVLEAEPLLNFDFLSEVLYLIEVIDDYTGRKDDRWALLFDELEIAPAWMLEKLILAFRSVGQKLVLKLTISPYTKIGVLASPNAPQSGQDFDLIRLWYGYKQEGRAFSSKLFERVLAENGINDTTPAKILGSSPLKGGDESSAGAYTIGSSHHKLLLRAYSNDSSFRDYCQKNKLNLNQINLLSEGERASLIRKITPTVIIRDTFRKPDRGDTSKILQRSRKRPTVYSGADTFFEMMEANPRWLIGVLHEMIPIIKKAGRVTPSKQLELIERTASRFTSMLATYPLGSEGNYSSVSLIRALDAIGAYIHKSVVLDHFSSEPFGSFTVDKQTPRAVFDALGTALNAGAIVLHGSENEHLGEGLLGKRFRLSYILSPHYKIPLRLSRPFPISAAIKTLKSIDEVPAKNKGASLHAIRPQQMELFR
jgi:hypothetical protein